MINRKRIVILGGGTSGWMTAAALSKKLSGNDYEITLVESDQIATVGVGEATIPHIRAFNQMLGIDENEFMQAVGATYKLAIKFEDWGTEGSEYFHPFGLGGHDINGVEFQHYFLRLQSQGIDLDFGDYSTAVVAAKNHRFAYPSEDNESPLAEYGYAFHIDASLYGQYLRKYAEANGVQRVEGRVSQVVCSEETGDIEKLTLESGQELTGALYIDCSGFRSLLLAEALDTGFDDWSDWLVCDRAIAAPTSAMDAPPPYTRSKAVKNGWLWQIPLQHRTGNGYVYSSRFEADASAENLLRGELGLTELNSATRVKFTAGKRKYAWSKNCVGIGLASGFLEPLESTSIYLVQIGINHLLDCLPRGENYEIERDKYNREMNLEYERIRDFIILHYHLNKRKDSPLWEYCAQMAIPQSLEEKINLFRESAQVWTYRSGLFMSPSWLAVYFGQGMKCDSYNLRANQNETQVLAQYLQSQKTQIYDEVSKMTTHNEALNISKESEKFYPGAALNLYGANYE
ncbi:MAG: tryptophan halogenase [Flavobacteriales bacterium]|jgi:tryptophan halogenase